MTLALLKELLLRTKNSFSQKKKKKKDQELISLYFLFPNICGEIFHFILDKFCNFILNLLVMFLLIIDS